MGTVQILNTTSKDKRKRGPDGRVLPDDLVGMKFGRLTPIEYISKRGWICRCDCGNTTIAKTQWLKEKRMVSCGCYKNEMRAKHSYKHGGWHNPLYKVWWGMKERCQNKNHKAYHRYGGRGITICKEWLDDYKTFEKWALNAGYEKGLTVERIDNDKGYSPDNCKMATRKEQSRNMRRNRRVARISESGETIAEYKTIVEAAEDTGCNQVSIGKVCMGKERSTHGMFWKYLN